MGWSSDFCTCPGSCYGEFTISQMAEPVLVWSGSPLLLCGVVVLCPYGAHELDAPDRWNPSRLSLLGWTHLVLCALCSFSKRGGRAYKSRTSSFSLHVLYYFSFLIWVLEGFVISPRSIFSCGSFHKLTGLCVLDILFCVV